MSVQERLNKSTVQFLKIAHHVVFARKRYENGRQIVVAVIYIAQDAHPIAAITGTDRFWDCHDISKATRSIRRHNKNCLILDRRDFIFEKTEDLKGFNGIH